MLSEIITMHARESGIPLGAQYAELISDFILQLTQSSRATLAKGQSKIQSIDQSIIGRKLEESTNPSTKRMLDQRDHSTIQNASYREYRQYRGCIVSSRFPLQIEGASLQGMGPLVKGAPERIATAVTSHTTSSRPSPGTCSHTAVTVSLLQSESRLGSIEAS